MASKFVSDLDLGKDIINRLKSITLVAELSFVINSTPQLHSTRMSMAWLSYFYKSRVLPVGNLRTSLHSSSTLLLLTHEFFPLQSSPLHSSIPNPFTMGHGSSFDPDRDIPSLEGKVILITGGNVGLGKQSALDLSKHLPSELWIAARSAKKAEAVIAEIKQTSPGVYVRFLELDLASFASIKTAAETFLSSVSRLDILCLMLVSWHALLVRLRRDMRCSLAQTTWGMLY